MACTPQRDDAVPSSTQRLSGWPLVGQSMGRSVRLFMKAFPQKIGVLEPFCFQLNALTNISPFFLAVFYIKFPAWNTRALHQEVRLHKQDSRAKNWNSTQKLLSKSF